MDKIKVFEAFSGYGSQSIALRNLGIDYEVVAISEINKYALQAYYSIHDKNIPNLGDISKIRVEDIPQHDLFTYSFPCQDISVAGKKEGIEKGKTRSGLLYECERIIEGCKPKYLLLENVKNLVGKKFKPQFDEWLAYLESLGYTNYWQVLNAKDYGVPQNRERVFVISILGEHKPYEFPGKIKLDKCIRDMLENDVDDKYYINKPFHFINKGHQAELEKIVFKQRCDEGMRFFKDNCVGTIRTIDAGGDKRVLEYTERTPLKFLNRNGKKTDDKYTFCVDTCHTGGIKEYYNDNTFRIRKLTPRECFRLMGLKDSDIDKIQATGLSNSQQYKMAGNSIVVQVLEGIFRQLFLVEG